MKRIVYIIIAFILLCVHSCNKEENTCFNQPCNHQRQICSRKTALLISLDVHLEKKKKYGWTEEEFYAHSRIIKDSINRIYDSGKHIRPSIFFKGLE